MRPAVLQLFILCFLLSFTMIASAQNKSKKEPPLTRILLIFDASNSMNAEFETETRIERAKKLFGNFVDSLQRLKNTELALRIYGHQKKFPPQDCNDTKLEIPFSKNNSELIKAKVKATVPKGTTPIAHSLTECVNDFPKGNALNMVILITDGIEECGGDPCEAARELLEDGIVLKPFIIGIGLTPEQAAKFNCVGDYFDIANPETFGSIIDIIIKKTLNETTAQVNLLDNYNRATVTNVSMSFVNRKTKETQYDFVHTMTNLNTPDTLRLKTSPTYKLVVHTIPEVQKDSIKLDPGRHNIISVKVPQGSLFLKYVGVGGFSKSDAPLCIVRKKGDPKILNVQKLNSTENYLEGDYNLEILTQPRIIKNDIYISPGSTTTVETQSTGMIKLFLSKVGYGSILLEEGNNLKFICPIDPNEKNQIFNLLPGTYRIEFREKDRKKANETLEERVILKSNEVKTVNIFY